MSTPPLVRHPALQPLSREHFNGLVQARRLTQASAAPTDEQGSTIHAFIHAWHTEISPHFDDEERLLTPLISAEEVSRLRAEHDQVRALVAEILAGQAVSERLRLLGRLLHDHIRWEERSLFPHVQAAAADHELEHIAAETRKVEAKRPGSRRRGDHPAPPHEPRSAPGNRPVP